MSAVSMLVIIFGLLLVFVKGEKTRIVGGYDAADGARPYQISMRKQGYHICGGSIIDEKWILTAAHCVKSSRPDELEIVTGTNYLDSGGDTYYVEKITPHEDYSSLFTINDIALLKLNSSIKYGPKVQPVALPKEDTPAHRKLVLSGWGTLVNAGDVPNKLQEIELVSVSNLKCFVNHPLRVYPSNICTYTKKGEGACHGDSGGPLVYYKDGVPEQVGVVSWGTPCAEGKPDVFTRVYAYLDWIEKHKS